MGFLNTIAPDILMQLIAHGDAARHEIEQGEGKTKDVCPLLHVRAGAAAQWLLSEYDSEQERFFGLCDLGQGFPELGYVALSDFDELTGGLAPHINGAFQASARLSAYAKAAKAHERIVLDIKPDPTYAAIFSLWLRPRLPLRCGARAVFVCAAERQAVGRHQARASWRFLPWWGSSNFCP